MEIKKWLNTTITRRDAIVATAKVGAAVTLSQAITLPFATTAQAQDTRYRRMPTAKPSGTAPVWSTVAADARLRLS
ncbi:anaerobic dimethyl sulfoxide reductase subunit A [Salmonella enterica subsp. enterica serovar Goldcoast]|nr:anaerobic dimethyl sulfoxide reductase subunit A [Salmonella enterica subsp. enterica serovar Goldcoast]